jgi:predicted NBD/HSP70 family sugar kinase
VTESVAPLRLALDLGGTTTRAALVRGGRVEQRSVAPTPAREGPEAAVAVAAELLTPFVGRVDAVCVAATGRVHDGRVSAVNRATLPGWGEFPLARALAELTGLPVRVVNDAHAATWGEARFGAGRGARDFAFVTVSTGIGAGVVAEGRLLRGARGLAGHLGFWNLAGDGVAGSVGAPDGGRTVLEHLASGTGIARAGSAACGEPLSTREVFERAEGGDARARAVVQEAVNALARALVDLRWLVDPERVAVGGSVGLAPGYLVALREALSRLEPEDPLAVVAADLGADAGLLGAAALLGS